MIGTGTPDFVELLVEVGCGLWVDNKTSFWVFALEDILEIVRGNIATVIACYGDDSDVFCWITVVRGEEFRLGFLKFWFDAGFLLYFCHDKNSIPSLEEMCYNMEHHAESDGCAMIF